MIQKRVISDQELKLFQLGPSATELPGVSADLFAELNDIVRKFGNYDLIDNVARLSMNGPIEVHVISTLDSFRRKLVIFGRGGEALGENTRVVKLGNDGSSSAVWDKRVSVSEVQAFIACIDSEMFKRGCIDKKNGERMER